MSTVFKMETYEPPPSEPTITIADTVASHIEILGKNLRDREIRMAEIAGLPPHRALWRVWRRSLMCKTVFLNGEVVAIWGVMGTFLGRVGKPWLVCSPAVEDFPMKVAFRYRSELRNMLRYFLVLEDWVMPSDVKTIRLMEILGFKFEEPKLMNGIEYMHVTLSRED